MILAIIKDKYGFTGNSLFDSKDDIQDEIIDSVELKVSGSDYQSRKDSARNVAISLQQMDIGGLSYFEESDIQQFLLSIGKRYGLMTEFYSEGIL